MRRVVVESPFKGANYEDTEGNLEYARACMADCLARGEAPIASHLLYTQEGILDDTKPEERQKGIDAGFAWNEHADATVVYADRGISKGMWLGIEHALNYGRPVELRTLYAELEASLEVVQNYA